ncbi:lysozyme inhibitor LprI family protein [Enterobacter sp. Bisph1]|uniref:lysozyme inhibitor LprI family protein n=1 Tax=Enterobacter sp. Bisph1 TaxID=1274399 RepID=UPI0018CE29D0|nr:lysozyme inhibitor LprI family protein [Enterobacter sp. Bisph1]
MTGRYRLTPAQMLSAICAMIMLQTVHLARAANTPASVFGDWRVISLSTDQSATVSFDTKIDDPRYVGRVIHFDTVAINGELTFAIDCQQPAFQPQAAMTLNEAIVKTNGERRFAPVTPVAEDFNLAPLGPQKITPMLVACQKGYLGPNGESLKNWVALLSEDKLVMNWDDNSYVVLQRVKAGDKVTPGFACAGSLSPVEQTICANNELAAWDRSVSDAYKIQIEEQREMDPSDKAALAGMKAAQRAWLAKRNQCQTDAGCLKKSMRDRTFELVSKIQ